MNITVFLPASQGGQEEVGHKSHVQHQTGGFMQGPEVREVQACVEVLLERAHAKGGEQARQVLGEVLGGGQLRAQVAVVLYTMQDEKEKLPEVFAFRVGLHS